MIIRHWAPLRVALIWLMLLLLVPLSHAQGPSRPAAQMRLLDLKTASTVLLADIVPALAQTDLVIIGESHGNREHHLAQLTIIQALHGSGVPMAIGLEMFQRRDQPVLDQWVAGTLSEQEMIQAFLRNWGDKWPAYRDIFIYCRDHGLPMIGLNVPRAITRKVAQQGFASLTREELGLLPPIVCRIDPEYEAFLRRFVSGHGHGEVFTRFCEAQLVWDTAMAVHALEFLQQRPQYAMVMLAGSVHAWKHAVPEQMQRLAPRITVTSITPEVPMHMHDSEVTVDDTDFLILISSRENGKPGP